MGTQPSRVCGYVRVSTEQQDESGAGLAAQETAIRGEVTRRGWTLVHLYKDVASGKSLSKRPQLERAVAALEAGQVETLIVSKLDRLSRSVVDFGSLMERARASGWNLIVLDLGIDLTTPAGEMVATIMASLAQWERRIISDRTRDALATRKAAGVKLGRPSGLSDEVRATIALLRRQGMGYRAIAAQMEALAVPTAQGGERWHASSVKKILAAMGVA